MSIEIKRSIKPVEYTYAIQLLEKRLNNVINKNAKELIWFLEHDIVYTAGTTSKSSEVLDKSLKIIKTSRGGKAPLTGEVITDARQDLDQSARPSISMQMNSSGAKNWRRLTSTNIGRRVAIVLDNYVYSAPFVQNERLVQRIPLNHLYF